MHNGLIFYAKHVSWKPPASAMTTMEGHESYLQKRGRSETERDSGMSAYSWTYSDERRTENENA